MSKSAPTPPDYTYAAEQTAKSNANATEAQTVANRPNINTPFGSQSWQMSPVFDPVTGEKVNTWTQNTTLDPTIEGALRSQQKVQAGQSGLAQSLLEQEYGQEKNPIDFNSMIKIGAAPGSGDQYAKSGADAAFKSYHEYNDPLQAQAKEQMDTQLRNQGLMPGDQAYDDAMKNLGTQQDAANRQATYGAIEEGSTMGQAEHGMDLANAQYNATASQAQMAQEMQKRGFTLNQIQAILSGQQVGMPSMPSFATAGNAGGTDYSGAARAQGQAANDQFSANQAGTQGLISGLGTAAGVAAMFF